MGAHLRLDVVVFEQSGVWGEWVRFPKAKWATSCSAALLGTTGAIARVMGTWISRDHGRTRQPLSTGRVRRADVYAAMGRSEALLGLSAMRNGRVGVMVRSEMAWRFWASQGGRGFNSARLKFMVEGCFWAARILMEEALVGRFGLPAYIQLCLCCRSTMMGEERGPGFLCLPLFSPFSVSHMFCVHHGLYRTGYHGSGSLIVWSFWFSGPGFAVSKKRNGSGQRTKRGKRG
jgi:hypothetical protein